MSQTVSPLSRSPFQQAEGSDFNAHRSKPLPRTRPSRGTTPKQEDRMDITTPPRASPRAQGPSSNESPEADQEMPNANGKSKTTGNANPSEQAPATNGTGGGGNTLSAAAAATSSQPKVVQTAFIHKLYNMLEDQSIRHLISWSSSNESFVMSPSQDFSKVLSQYFKHTNISSFVRQLNMYGFHKVSDVFHTGQPESALWEFKHGQGNFKRGDLNGLREIRRRASRHALIHRDSFSSPHRPSVSQPGTPAEPLPEAAPADPRLTSIESTLYELHARLARTEESNTALSTKCAYLSENLARCQQWSNDLAQIVMKMIPDQESQLYRDVATIQKDVARHFEAHRAHDEAHDTLRQPYYGHDTMPLSPRQAPQEERRPSLHGPSGRSNFRPPPAGPYSSAVPQRRYGSIGHSAHAPSYHHRPSVTVQPPHTPTHQPHPLASVTEPGNSIGSGANLARRHTSADIRDTAGWPPQGPQAAPSERSPYDGSQHPQGPPQWPPSSPSGRVDPQAHELRQQLGSYEFGQARRSTVVGPAGAGQSRGASPPPPHAEPVAPHQQAPPPPSHHQPPQSMPSPGGPFQQDNQQPPPIKGPFGEMNGWSFAAASGGSNKLAPRFAAADHSAPGTRRSSMASNVHNLLNPAGDAGREEDDEGPGKGPEEGNKRKRVG